jgi:hypothetical protein
MGIISERIDGKIINVDVKSSNIKFASYDTETKTLTITFNTNQKYEYYDVPWKIFTRFRSESSQGKYFTQNIKSKYKFKKV